MRAVSDHQWLRLASAALALTAFLSLAPRPVTTPRHRPHRHAAGVAHAGVWAVPADGPDVDGQSAAFEAATSQIAEAPPIRIVPAVARVSDTQPLRRRIIRLKLFADDDPLLP